MANCEIGEYLTEVCVFERTSVIHAFKCTVIEPVRELSVPFNDLPSDKDAYAMRSVLSILTNL